MREFVGQSAEDSGMVSSDIYAVQLAVDEAFTNIVEHAYGGECLEEVDCICQNTENALIITLKDCGEPFNPLDVPSPDLESDLEKRKIGGLGLYFMRQLMDEIQFTFLPESESDEGCNILRMVKLKEKKSSGSRAP